METVENFKTNVRFILRQKNMKVTELARLYKQNNHGTVDSARKKMSRMINSKEANTRIGICISEVEKLGRILGVPPQVLAFSHPKDFIEWWHTEEVLKGLYS